MIDVLTKTKKLKVSPARTPNMDEHVLEEGMDVCLGLFHRRIPELKKEKTGGRLNMLVSISDCQLVRSQLLGQIHS